MIGPPFRGARELVSSAQTDQPDQVAVREDTASHVASRFGAATNGPPFSLLLHVASPIGRFVSNHPTIKMLALSYLMVVGVVLVAEGFEHPVPRGYAYFAMTFSLTVEMLNIRMRKKKSTKTVELNPPGA